MSWEDNKNRSY